MKKVAAIATHQGREKSLLAVLKSIRRQVDEIWIHINGDFKLSPEHVNLIDFITHHDEDLTDNGKFYPLSFIAEDCYYLSMDDDIWYAPDYVTNIVNNCEKYECIITHHGRVLLGKNRQYYTGHFTVKCLAKNDDYKFLDVAGTGVTCFKTSYFKPDIWNSEHKRMSDLVFSLEAAKQGKKILVIPHKKGHMKDISPDKGIFGSFSKNKTIEQNKLADQIYEIKKLSK